MSEIKSSFLVNLIFLI